MAKPWTVEQARQKFSELYYWYVKNNRTIGEISKILNIGQSTVYDRLLKLGIHSTPELKITYAARRRNKIVVPKRYTAELAEFFGIMLGDGRLAPYQIVVTLGTKESAYVLYVVDLIKRLFKVRPKVCTRKFGYHDIYLGSLNLVEWLRKEGLVHNKVKSQVDVPKWIFSTRKYMNRFLRGFFDTDGSIYRLKSGSLQIAFTNKSIPILESIRRITHLFGYVPSQISGFHIYITRQEEVIRFFKEIKPANSKHQQRYKTFLRR